MQRILNNPDNIVDEMLQGFIKAHGDIVEAAQDSRVVRARDIPPGKVPGTSRHLSDMWGKTCVMRRLWERSVLLPRQKPF